MATQIRYNLGGYNASAPAQNKAEQWSNGTQVGDPAAGYTAWDASGNVTAQRALTTTESNALAAQDTATTAVTNQATIQQQAQNAITNNQAYVALASPTNAQVVAQVQALTRQVNALIRLALGKFDATS